MDISYKDKKLQSIFNDERKLNKKYTADIKEIKMRMKELQRVDNLAEMFDIRNQGATN